MELRRREVQLTTSKLLGAADVRRLAQACGIRPTKQRGQNFVIDANTVRRIVRTSGIGEHDVVLEVGPGLGSLTLGLLEVAQRVVAIEIDEILAGALPATITEFAPDRVDNFEVVLADAMRITDIPGPPPTALVANLPYNVSVPVLLHLFALLPSVKTGLVMVQSEVAQRLAAPPGSRTYGVPSVKAAWYADVRLAGKIGRNVFWPMPNVDSALVAWTRHELPRDMGQRDSAQRDSAHRDSAQRDSAQRERVFAVVDAAFAQRRKTLRATLTGIAGSAMEAENALVAAGVSPQARGEAIGVEDFARIAACLPQPAHG